MWNYDVMIFLIMNTVNQTLIFITVFIFSQKKTTTMTSPSSGNYFNIGKTNNSDEVYLLSIDKITSNRTFLFISL